MRKIIMRVIALNLLNTPFSPYYNIQQYLLCKCPGKSGVIKSAFVCMCVRFFFPFLSFVHTIKCICRALQFPPNTVLMFILNANNYSFHDFSTIFRVDPIGKFQFDARFGLFRLNFVAHKIAFI